jgi:hypothetical protein
MEKFDSNEDDTIQVYSDILPKPADVSFTCPNDIATWKQEKFDRKYAFMPESPVMMLIRCDVLELMDLVTLNASEASKFSLPVDNIIIRKQF